MAIDFTLTPLQSQLQRDARAFAREVLVKVGPAVLHLTTPEARFAATRPFYEQLIAAGFLRRLIPAPLGGSCTSGLDLAIVAEEFYTVDVNVSLTLFGTLLGLVPIMMAGSPDQQARFLPPFLATTGAPLAAFASSEPGGSANFAAPAPGAGVRTTAILDGEDWVINGAKQWISSGTGWDGRGPDMTCVVCRTDATRPTDQALSIIAVPRPEQGITTVRNAESMGHRAHLTPRYRIENVRVPEHNVLGALNGGKPIVEAAFAATAPIVGVFGVALMRAAFDFALRFAKTECRGGGEPIIHHQAVGYALADAKMAIEAVRYLSWRACAAQDAQAPGALEVALQTKVFGSETAVKVITDLMRVVGIDSYDHELPLAGLLQDAMALPLFDGGNMGVRRRQLHTLMLDPAYDPLTASATPG